MHLRTSILLATLATASLALSGCGRSDAPASSAVAAAAAPATDARRTIDVTADDAMKFNLTEIRAKPGEALRVTLKNIGQMPRTVMGHNWVLLKSMSDSDVN